MPGQVVLSVQGVWGREGMGATATDSASVPGWVPPWRNDSVEKRLREPGQSGLLGNGACGCTAAERQGQGVGEGVDGGSMDLSMGQRSDSCKTWGWGMSWPSVGEKWGTAGVKPARWTVVPVSPCHWISLYSPPGAGINLEPRALCPPQFRGKRCGTGENGTPWSSPALSWALS